MSSTAAQTATGYQHTFGGRADQLSQVRDQIAGYLKDCPVTQDMVLIADELAANAILHTHSRGSTFHVRCQLSPGTARIEVEDGAAGGGTARPVTAPTGWTSSRPSPAQADGEPGPQAPEAA